MTTCSLCGSSGTCDPCMDRTACLNRRELWKGGGQHQCRLCGTKVQEDIHPDMTTLQQLRDRRKNLKDPSHICVHKEMCSERRDIQRLVTEGRDRPLDVTTSTNLREGGGGLNPRWSSYIDPARRYQGSAYLDNNQQRANFAYNMRVANLHDALSELTSARTRIALRYWHAIREDRYARALRFERERANAHATQATQEGTESLGFGPVRPLPSQAEYNDLVDEVVAISSGEDE